MPPHQSETHPKIYQEATREVSHFPCGFLDFFEQRRLLPTFNHPPLNARPQTKDLMPSFLRRKVATLFRGLRREKVAPAVRFRSTSCELPVDSLRHVILLPVAITFGTALEVRGFSAASVPSHDFH